jgi:outer membrane receptor protein involved in Fe transport
MNTRHTLRDNCSIHIWEFILLLFIICIPRTIFSQDITKAHYAISGIIVDSATISPLPGANIRVVDSNNKTINGTVSDTAGHFSLLSIPGNTKIIISLIGYKEVQLDSLEQYSGKTTVQIPMDAIYLRTAEIVVKGEKQLIEYFVDKQVVNLDKMPGIKGNTVIQALEKTGLVIVDPVTKDISLRGNKGVSLKIDGLNMPNASDLIKQLDASSVDKIEIMSAPSAKYEAEGDAGIVNIVLKHNLGDYFSGNISATYNTQGNVYTNLCLNFKKDNFGLFLLSGWYDSKMNNTSFGSASNTNSLASYRTNAFYSSHFNTDSKYIMFGTDYDITPNNFLSAHVTFQPGKYNYGGISDVQYHYQSTLSDFSYHKNYGTSNRVSHTFSTAVFERIKFATPDKELTNYIQYDKLSNTNPYDEETYYSNVVKPELKHDNTDTHNYTLVIATNFVDPLKDSSKFETGYNFTHRDRTTDYNTAFFNDSLQAWRDTGGFSNSFNYKESILGAYCTYADKVSIFDYKLGLRAEYTDAHGFVRTTSQEFRHSYTDLFPTGNIAYRLSPSTQLVFSVTRRITRPRMEYVNPFYIVTSKYTASAGNPDLKPMYNMKYELAFNPYITFYYSNGNGKQQSVLVNRPDGTLINTTMNLGSIKTTGADLTLQVSQWTMPIISYPSWWSMANVIVSFQHTTETGSSSYSTSTEQWDVKSDVWHINTYFSILPGLGCNVTAGYTLSPRYTDARGISYTTSNLYININRSFFQDKLNLSLNGNDLLNKGKRRGLNSGSSYSSYYESVTAKDRNVSLSISWRFNNYQRQETHNMSDGRD